MYTQEKLHQIATYVVQSLLYSKETLSVAESITGGLLCSVITDVPGSSDVLLEGIVPYTIKAKSARLAISEKDIQTHGVISSFTPKAMAKNIKTTLQTDYGISLTGNAGPGVDQAGSKIGTVYIGMSTPNGTLLCQHFEFPSNLSREEIKLKAVLGGIEFLWDQIQKNHTL